MKFGNDEKPEMIDSFHTIFNSKTRTSLNPTDDFFRTGHLL